MGGKYDILTGKFMSDGIFVMEVTKFTIWMDGVVIVSVTERNRCKHGTKQVSSSNPGCGNI